MYSKRQRPFLQVFKKGERSSVRYTLLESKVFSIDLTPSNFNCLGCLLLLAKTKHRLFQIHIIRTIRFTAGLINGAQAIIVFRQRRIDRKQNRRISKLTAIPYSARRLSTSFNIDGSLQTDGRRKLAEKKYVKKGGREMSAS